MLATGLSGLYSLLPTSVDLIEDDWVSPLTHLQDTVPELKSFMQALSYCNSVLQVSTCTLLYIMYIMHIDFGGCGLSGYGDKISLWSIKVEKFNRSESAKKIHASRDQCHVHSHQFWWA